MPRLPEAAHVLAQDRDGDAGLPTRLHESGACRVGAAVDGQGEDAARRRIERNEGIRPRAVKGRGRGPGVDDDIARICEIWRDCRGRYGAGGDFLFGVFGAADAMFAPVVTRLDTYGVDLDETCAAYGRAVLTLPAFVEWCDAALQEPWIVPEDEID